VSASETVVNTTAVSAGRRWVRDQANAFTHVSTMEMESRRIGWWTLNQSMFNADWLGAMCSSMRGILSDTTSLNSLAHAALGDRWMARTLSSVEMTDSLRWRRH